MRRRGETVRLFENDLLERLSHVHSLTPLLLWMPVIAALLWRSHAQRRLEAAVVTALAAAGLLVWSFSEYAIHRFAFHLAPTSRVGRRLQFIFHGVHHEHPDDPARLLMPPALAIVMVALLYALFRIVLGSAWVEPFFAFFLLGYLVYDYTHFAIHHRSPPTCLGRYLRRRHMLHHFVTPDARWGVTSPLWDCVFGTTGHRSRAGPSSRDVPMRRRRRRLAAGGATTLLVAAALLAVTTAAPAVEWERISDKDGVLVERRVIPGSRFNGIRVTAHSPLAPAAVFETIWKQQEHLEFVPYLHRSSLLSDTGDERVVYEQLALPFVRDRDYTVRLRKGVDPTAQRYEIFIVSANDLGPPDDGAYVRVTNIRGGWIIEPGPDGKGSLIRYEMQSNPGGMIPAWVVNRAERDAAANLVRAMLKRALEKNGGR